MSQKANPRLIGIFVIGAIALLVAAVVAVGSGRFFTRAQTYVMFFEDDVGGLQVGAPVTFRGVRLGSVTGIQIRYDTDARQITIPVMVELDMRQVRLVGRASQETIDQLIERGLRARLKLQSFVTGQAGVELDFDPGSPAHFVGIVKNYPEIPTQRSSISEFRATLTDLISELRKLPVGELLERVNDISANLSTLIIHVDGLVVDVNNHLNDSFTEVPALVAESRGMVADLDTVARDLSKLTRDVNKDVPAISKGATDAIARLNKTLERAQTSMSSIENNLGERSPLQYQMNQALTEITAAASAMRNLAEYLQENPSVLLSGKGAERK
jgi:paraquat-inducible protein B